MANVAVEAIARRATGMLSSLGARVLDTILPPQCIGCGAQIDRIGHLCPGCWSSLNFISEPCCVRCGFPFEFAAAQGDICAACGTAPPVCRRVRAVMRYDAACRGLILGFKHGDRLERAPAFGTWLRRAGADLLREADMIVPVPLHRWRLIRRRYNQSAVLALNLGRQSGLPTVADALIRTRPTPPQGGMSAAGRRRNVAGAFSISPRRQQAIAGRRVLLIDDVMTTGATLDACARTLLRAGAMQVDGLVVARVVRASAPLI